MSSNSPKKNLIRGAAWTVGARMCIKVLGFVNTIVMARLLMPEDYGLVAMAMLVVGLVQTMLDFGAVGALERKEKLTTDDIDSAWTLKIMQSTGTALLIALSPIIAAPLFEDPRVTHILWVLAGCTLASSLTSLSPVISTKSFDYALSFKINICSKLGSVVMTIIFGLWLKDYRALVIGIMTGYLTPIGLSYKWHPLRHRINFSKIGEIWAFTKWLMVANVGGYVLRKGDEMAAARIGTTAEYGNYNVGADLGSLPVAEVGPAVLQALLPVLATIQSDIKRTNLAISKTMSALGTLIWPLGFGTLVTAPQVTHILLGEKWHGAAIFVGLYGIITVLQTLSTPLKTLLTLRGHTRIQSHLVWLEFGAFATLALWMTPIHGLIALGWARLIASTLNFAMVLVATARYCQLSIPKMALHLLRPFTGAALMAALLTQLPTWTANMPLSLATTVLIGALFFGAWSIVTWQMAGRPEGLESTLVERLFPHIKKIGI